MARKILLHQNRHLKVMGMDKDHFSIKGFTLLDGREVRLYCRLLQVRQAFVATYSLYEDYRGRQWLEIAAGGRSHLEELIGESFEQRVAADLLALGLNKYSG
jgi:hypothetical protein